MDGTKVLPPRDDAACDAGRARERAAAVQEIRHSCSRMMFIVRRNGIELHCDKCGSLILYTWREILTMMLAAEMSKA